MNDIAVIVTITSLVVIGVGTAALLATLGTRRRRKGFESEAEQLGLPCLPHDAAGIQSRCAAFQLFREGRQRKVTNLITAEAEGIRINVFDYHFVVGSGKSQHTVKTTVVAVESASLRLPALMMRPENLIDTLAGLFGMQDIDFPENKAFSRNFLLRSEHEEIVRGLFSRKVQEYFTARRGCSFEAAGPRFVSYRRGKRIKPMNLKIAMAEGLELHQLLDEQMARLQGGSPDG